MGYRKSERARERVAAALLPLLLSTLFVLTGCRGTSPSAPGAGPAAPSRTPAAAPRPDPALDQLFSGIAGLSGAPAAAKDWRQEPSWTAFTDLVNREYAHFDETVLAPMRVWSGTELREARKTSISLFYIFGGPDFVTSSTLFPEARETVLIGLEPAGNLPALDKVSPAWREAFFADLGELISGFLERGYFITKDMNDIYSRGKVDGALPVIAFFLGRGRFSVVSITRLSPDGTGGWTETPYERLAVRPRRPYGVKILYLTPGSPEVRSVVYFSCDVEDKAFPPGSPLYRYLAGLERITSFVKSGSYLLHWNNFSILRNFILDRSLFVLEDDTAVPYRYFKNAGWDIRLFGQYGTPVSDFSNVEQPDLRRAYEADGASVAPLPFHFGYHWRTQIDNLLLAKRPRRPYKQPVLR